MSSICMKAESGRGAKDRARAQLTRDELSLSSGERLSLSRALSVTVRFTASCFSQIRLVKNAMRWIKRKVCACAEERSSAKWKVARGSPFLHAWHLVGMKELEICVTLWDFEVDGTNSNVTYTHVLVAVIPCVRFPQNHSTSWRPQTWVLYRLTEIYINTQHKSVISRRQRASLFRFIEFWIVWQEQKDSNSLFKRWHKIAGNSTVNACVNMTYWLL